MYYTYFINRIIKFFYEIFIGQFFEKCRFLRKKGAFETGKLIQQADRFLGGLKMAEL
jgi:hypothetical protein